MSSNRKPCCCAEMRRTLRDAAVMTVTGLNGLLLLLGHIHVQ
jgi:hypothetical protein